MILCVCSYTGVLLLSVVYSLFTVMFVV